MAQPMEKTVIATVLFLDIVGYSRQPVGQQLTWKADFNDTISQLLAAGSEQDRIVLDTGDGAALCFLDNPEDALELAMRLRERARASEGELEYQLYMGINLGPVKIVRDLNQHRNLLGDGINVAQRVMSFAQPNQILVSRSFYDIAAYLTRRDRSIFHYRGIQADKHGREHEIYEVLPEGAPATPPSASSIIRPGENRLPADALAALESSYAEFVGPIASTLVRRAARDANNLESLCQRLAGLIENTDDRQRFLDSYTAKLSATTTTAATAIPDPSPTIAANPPVEPPVMLDESTRQAMEQALARVIGPIARVLLNREVARGGNRQALCQRLAERIKDLDERQRFLERFGGE